MSLDVATPADDGIASTPARAAMRTMLQAQIAAEVARQDAFPRARTTLQLLLEAAVEPITDAPGYRVVDRAGVPRTRPGPEEGSSLPLTLADVFDEIRARHPDLFMPPAPDPEPVVAEPAKPAAAPSDVKRATARFVETQSTRARAVLARSAVEGRAAAAALSGALVVLRQRFDAGRPPKGYPAAPGTEPDTRADRLGGTRETARRLADRAKMRFDGLVDLISRTRDALPSGDGLRNTLRRPATLIGAGALGFAVLVAVLASRNVAEDEAVPGRQVEAQDTTTATPPPEDTSQTPPPEEAAKAGPAPGIQVPPKATDITGPTEVIDTATLRVGGKLVRLFGVEWVRGGQSDELTRYLAGRTVTCTPVAGSEARLCSVDGRDLSEVVLFNGGGRASSEATPDLVAAEDRARTERLGVWAR